MCHIFLFFLLITRSIHLHHRITDFHILVFQKESKHLLCILLCYSNNLGLGAVRRDWAIKPKSWYVDFQRLYKLISHCFGKKAHYSIKKTSFCLLSSIMCLVGGLIKICPLSHNQAAVFISLCRFFFFFLDLKWIVGIFQRTPHGDS